VPSFADASAGDVDPLRGQVLAEHAIVEIALQLPLPDIEVLAGYAYTA